MGKIIFVIFALLFIYTVIPYAMAAGLGIKVFRKQKYSNKIAFTFDDGPDPNYTPILLDLLKEHDIKATFFVLGSKAKKHPELILRMKQEGHLIGIHNFVHRSNWVMAPWTVRQQIEESADILWQITGERPVFYRPPWGLLNIVDFFRKSNFRIILWSVMAHDWRSAGGHERVKGELLRKIKGGDIVLLHDSGDTLGANEDAPMNTIRALEYVLKEVVDKGLVPVRVDELIGPEYEYMVPGNTVIDVQQ